MENRNCWRNSIIILIITLYKNKNSRILDIQFSEDLWKGFNFTVTWFLKYLSAFIFWIIVGMKWSLTRVSNNIQVYLVRNLVKIDRGVRILERKFCRNIYLNFLKNDYITDM